MRRHLLRRRVRRHAPYSEKRGWNDYEHGWNEPERRGGRTPQEASHRRSADAASSASSKERLRTELVFVLDASGSMSGLEDDTIGGFNALIEECAVIVQSLWYLRGAARFTKATRSAPPSGTPLRQAERCMPAYGMQVGHIATAHSDSKEKAPNHSVPFQANHLLRPYRSNRATRAVREQRHRSAHQTMRAAYASSAFLAMVASSLKLSVSS